MEKLESEILAIQERNKRVELDKQWERSFTRRGFIALLTYLTALWFLWLNDIPSAALQALVPAVAYIFSTLTLPPMKRWWMKRKN